MRFGFIHVLALSKPFNITALRRVCQIKPTNYQVLLQPGALTTTPLLYIQSLLTTNMNAKGALASSDDLINQIWWIAAYTVKVNLLPDYFGMLFWS